MLITINELLSMQKALVARRQQLVELRNSCTQRTIYASFGDRQGRTEEPTYDIKQVDKKVTQINNALFKIDAKIKASNAVTAIEVDIDFDALSAEI